MKNNLKDNVSPILIPSDSYLEGYLKSLKSIRIECNFNGTILTKKFKVFPGNIYVGNPIKKIGKNTVGIKRKNISIQYLKKEILRFRNIIKKHPLYE